jgi:hypothetical protein
MTEFKKENNKEQFKNQIIFLIFSKYYNLFVIFIVLIFALVSLFYIIEPKYEKIAENKEKIITEKNDEKIELSKLYEKIKEYQSAYNSITDNDKEKINDMFVDNKNRESLFGEVDTIVSGQGMTLLSIKLANNSSKNTKSSAGDTDSAKSNLPGAGKIIFNINIVGADYGGFKKLLTAFEKNLRIMDISKLAFSPSDKTAALEISAYYLK